MKRSKSHHKSLVVGLGVSGTRHQRILSELGSSADSIGRRMSPELFSKLIQGELDLSEYDLVVVATETSMHQPVLEGIARAKYSGNVLLEKPGLVDMSKASSLDGQKIFVAYNLRYLEGLVHIKKLIEEGNKPLRVGISAMSYLPLWRPSDQREHQYSRVSSLGGGALLDLSHEIDYANWIFGDWTQVLSIGGKVGEVTVDADDSWKVIGSTELCSQISLDLSLTSQLPRRECFVDFDKFSIRYDLIAGKIERSDKNVQSVNLINDTYGLMIRDLIEGNIERLPTLEKNRTTLSLIEQIRLQPESRKKK